MTDDSELSQARFQVTMRVLVIFNFLLYASLFLATLYFILWRVGKRIATFNIIKQFLVFLLVASAGRMSYFALCASMTSYSPAFFSDRASYYQLLCDLSGLAFYLSYLLLLCLWAKVYFAAKKVKAMQRVPLTLIYWVFALLLGATVITLNVLSHVIVIGPGSSSSSSGLDNDYIYVIPIHVIYPALALFLCAGYVFFGINLYREMRANIGWSATPKHLKQISILTAFCTVSFFLRALLVIIGLIFVIAGRRAEPEVRILEMCSYVLLDWMPSIVALVAVNKIKVFREKSHTPKLDPAEDESDRSAFLTAASLPEGYSTFGKRERRYRRSEPVGRITRMSSPEKEQSSSDSEDDLDMTRLDEVLKNARIDSSDRFSRRLAEEMSGFSAEEVESDGGE